MKKKIVPAAGGGGHFCPDPGLNQGPLDLQSNALPTELSRPASSNGLSLSITWYQYHYIQPRNMSIYTSPFKLNEACYHFKLKIIT